MNIFIAVLMAIIFLVTPFNRGLFFDEDFYFYHIVLAILFIIWTSYSLYKKDTVPLIYYSIFLIPLANVLSLPVAETPEGAVDNLLRWLDYSVFFILLVYICKDQKVKAYAPYVFSGLGFILSLFAILGYFGLTDYKDVILVDPDGNKRFTSVFQYGNTFAAVMGAFWLFNLVWITDKNGSWIRFVLLTIPLSVFSLDFLHSYSRGALVLFPLAWVIGLIILPFERQVKFTIYTIVSVLSGIVIFRFLGVISLLSITVLSTILMILFEMFIRKKGEHRLVRISQFKFSRYYLLLVTAISGVLLYLDIVNQGFIYKQLPATFQQRVSDISLGTYSVQGRTLFFEDALKMIKDHPLLGVGGEGWRILFTKYQEVPYWSNETHNGYLEVLLNTGWIGLIIFAIVMLLLFNNTIKNYKINKNIYTEASIPALIILFIHSAIDFNFSYGTVWYIIFVLFVISYQSNAENISIKSALHYSIRGLGIVFALILLVYSAKFYLAEKQLETFTEKKVNEEMVLKLLKSNPYSVENRKLAVDLYLHLEEKTGDKKYRNEIVKSLQELATLEPHNPKVLLNVGVTYINLGDYKKGFHFINQVLELDHYNVSYYEDIIKIKNQMMLNYLNDKNYPSALEMAAMIESDYNLMNQWYLKMQSHPVQINERLFKIPSGIKIHAAQALMFDGKYKDVILILNGINEDLDSKAKRQVVAMLGTALQLTGEQKRGQEIIKQSNVEDLSGLYMNTIKLLHG